MRPISSSVLAGARILPAAAASPNFQAWARKPTFGSGLATFSSPAVTVQMTSHAAGTIVTQANCSRFILNSTTVHRISAIAASIWFEAPNSGHSVQMPPNGSMTPW